jgi:hypothetical protein
MVRKRLLLRNVDAERCIQRLDLQPIFLDVQKQLAREQRATAGCRVAVHDKRWRLELPVKRRGRRVLYVFAGTAKMHTREGKPVVVIVAMFLV